MKYCGHILIENGKITIDIGGKTLPDGVYSILQEHQAPEKKTASVFNGKKAKLDTFEADLNKYMLLCYDRGESPTKQGAAEYMGINVSWFYKSVKRLGLTQLFND